MGVGSHGVIGGRTTECGYARGNRVDFERARQIIHVQDNRSATTPRSAKLYHAGAKGYRAIW